MIQQPIEHLCYREIVELNTSTNPIIGLSHTSTMIYAVTKKHELICYPLSVFKTNSADGERKFTDIVESNIQKFGILKANKLYHLLILTNNQIYISTETSQGLQKFHPAQFDSYPAQALNFVTISDNALLVVITPQYIYIYIYDGESFITKDCIENPIKKAIDMVGSLTNYLIYDKNNYYIYDIDNQEVESDNLPKNFKMFYGVERSNAFFYLNTENQVQQIGNDAEQHTKYTFPEDVLALNVRPPFYLAVMSKQFMMKNIGMPIDETLNIKIKNPIIDVIDGYNIVIGGNSSICTIKFHMNKTSPYIPQIFRLKNAMKRYRDKDPNYFYDYIIRVCEKFDAQSFDINSILDDMYYEYSESLILARDYQKAFEMFVKSKKHPFHIIHNFRVLLHSQEEQPQYDFLSLANEDCNKYIELVKETQKAINLAIQKKKDKENYDNEIDEIVKRRIDCIIQSGQSISYPTASQVRNKLDELQKWAERSIDEANATSHNISNILFSLKPAKINAREDGIYELQLYINDHVIKNERQPTTLKIYNTILIECYAIMIPQKLTPFLNGKNPPLFFDVAAAALKPSAPEEFRRLCSIHHRHDLALKPLFDANPICWDGVIAYIRDSSNFIELGDKYFTEVYTQINEKSKDKCVEMFFSPCLSDKKIDKAKLSDMIIEILRIIEEKCPLTINSKNVFETDDEKKNRTELIAKMQVKFLFYAVYRCRVTIQLAHWNLIKLYLKLISLYVTKPATPTNSSNNLASTSPSQVVTSPELPKKQRYVPISEEKSPLKEYRTRLLDILNKSNLYRTQEVLDAIKDVSNNLIEERITVLKKATPPKILEAVHLITRPSFPFEIAIRFCDEVYKNEIDKTVYNKLFDTYYQRRRAAKGPTEKLDASMKKLLNTRATRMQLDGVVNRVPKSFKVNEMNEFMKAATSHRINCLRVLKLRNALLEKTIQMKKLQLQELEKGKAVVTDGLKCIICGKKIGESVFIAQKDATVAHLACKLSADSI